MKIFQKFQSPSRQIDPVLQLGFYKKNLYLDSFMVKFEVFLKKCGEITVFPQETHITKKSIFKVRDTKKFIKVKL